MFSKLWTLKLSDWERGLIVAIISMPIGILIDWATTTGYQLNWVSLVKGAVAGGLAYIGKNFITGSGGNVLTNSDKSLITGKTTKDVCTKMLPYIIIPILLLGTPMVMMQSCATINALVTKQELTPAARYYDALKTFNRNVEQYNAVYDLSDPATKAKWKAEIDPLIRAASAALDAWKVALNTPTAADKEKVWQDASKNVLAILVSTGIIKIEGGK